MSGRSTNNTATDNNEKAKSDSDSKSDNEFKGNEKNLTTIKGQTTTTHYKTANIKGYTFAGLKFYVDSLDIDTIYKLSYDIIGTSPINFILKKFK